MASIGTVTYDPNTNAYEGTIHTPTISGDVEFEPLDQENDKAPSHRIVLENGYELGAAWTKTKKDTGEEYLSLKLDAPEFPAAIYPGLGRKPGTDPEDKVFSIIWNRRSK